MIKTLKIICLIVLCSTVHIYSNGLGYIEISKVFSGYEVAQKLQEKIKEKEEKLVTKSDKMREKWEVRIKKARKKNASDEELEKIIAEADEEVKEQIGPEREEVIVLAQQSEQKIYSDIMKATQETAKEYGLEIVVDKRSVYYGGFDLTNFVIEKLNSKKNK